MEPSQPAAARYHLQRILGVTFGMAVGRFDYPRRSYIGGAVLCLKAAAFLLDLRPGNVGYSGVAAGAAGMPSLREIPDWDAVAAAWREQLLQLLQDHLTGAASLATAAASCRHCHLPALCRRAAVEDAEADDE